ncbi:MAG: hypothetical protein ACI8P0_005547 [Planctomycetaceae bacterium]|jgi:hypothetical protein
MRQVRSSDKRHAGFAVQSSTARFGILSKSTRLRVNTVIASYGRELQNSRPSMVSLPSRSVRLTVMPITRNFGQRDEKADRRRALTEDELVSLFDTASRRPFEEAMTIRRGSRKGDGFAARVATVRVDER